MKPVPVLSIVMLILVFMASYMCWDHSRELSLDQACPSPPVLCASYAHERLAICDVLAHDDVRAACITTAIADYNTCASAPY